MALTEKVKKVIRSRAFLLKLIVTILGFICIPLLAMQIFVINESTDEFRKTNEEYYSTILQSSAQTFASREQILSQTALRISMNADIQRPLRQNPPALSDKNAAEALSNYGAEIMHMESVGVFYISKGYLLIDGVQYDLDEYCARKEPSDPEKLKEFLSSTKTMDYFISSDGNTLYAARSISLVAPGRNDAVTFFVMDATTLEESYRTAIDSQASFAILNERGEFLLRGEDFRGNISESALSSFLNSRSTTCVAGENDDLILYRHIDPESKFSFLLAMDKVEAQEQLLTFANKVRITTWIVVAVVVAALLMTIYINYKPIHRLLKKYGNTGQRDAFSEIEQLDSALFRLDMERSNQKDLLTEFILGDLIFGKTVKPELLNRYFPPERHRSCVVLIAQCTALTTAQAKLLAEKLEKATLCMVHVTSVPNRPHMVIVCISEQPINEENLCSCITEIIAETMGVSCPVCMGEVVSDILQLRTSYRSAVAVNLEPAFAEPGTNAGELNKKLQIMSQCICVGDEAEALAQLEDIQKFLYTHTVGEGHLRYYGFKLLNTYLTSVDNGNVRLSGQEVELLLSYTNMDHLFKLLSESIHQVCGQMMDMEHTMDLQMQQNLLQFVDENFQRSELCLTMAADHIGASIYAVSRLFKEITGKGFKDYVTEKRLEYGHRMLCTTNASIAEIAAAAGFDNANYFSTIFKQKYGMPPTKYRNEHKEKQQGE